MLFVLALLMSINKIQTHSLQKRALRVHRCPDQENYPWIVSLQTNISHKCNGIILDERNVLTTAFCCQEKLKCSEVGPNLDLVVVYSFGKPERFPFGDQCEIIPIDRCIKHERYDRRKFTAQYDVAVVRLARSLTAHTNDPLFFNKLAPIPQDCVYDGDYSDICKNGEVAGRWNHYEQKVPNAPFECFSVTLKQMTKCDEVIKFVFLQRKERTLTCSFDASNRFEVCSAFYGAPLMCDGRIVGLISHKFNFSEQCEEVSPFFYSRIDFSLDFIKEHSQKFTKGVYMRMMNQSWISARGVERNCSPRIIAAKAALFICLSVVSVLVSRQ